MKIRHISLALTISAATIAYAAPAAKDTLRLNTVVDSLNYAFGYTNGTGMRNYMLQNDTADANARMTRFAAGFSETFKEQDSYERIHTGALRFGAIIYRDTKAGHLLGDSLLPFNKKLFEKTLFRSIEGKKLPMQPDVAMAHVGALMNPGSKTDTTYTKAAIDTLNMAFAIANGSQIRQHVMRADTATKDSKTFRSGYTRGIKLGKANDTAYIEALRIGSGTYARLSTAKGIMDNPELPFNLDIFRRSAVDGILASSDALMTAAEAESYFIGVMQEIENEKREKLAEEGANFLRENAEKDGIITTESGLQYRVERMGDGARPAASDRVKVHYEGTLIDGTVFDSSYRRGEPLTFGLRQVIKGWTEGVQLMPVGSKFTFYVPYTLGYGERGAGDDIPPFATLIFTIELLGIEK